MESWAEIKKAETPLAEIWRKGGWKVWRVGDERRRGGVEIWRKQKKDGRVGGGWRSEMVRLRLQWRKKGWRNFVS